MKAPLFLALRLLLAAPANAQGHDLAIESIDFAGKAAGAHVVALRTTAGDAELREAGADWIVQDCAELSVDPGKDGEEFLLLRRRTK